MSAPKRRPAPEVPDLSTQTDFQLLNIFISLVKKLASPDLIPVAWEIMGRYTSSLEQAPPKRKDYDMLLGDARWGDAKRVEAIFGIKRSPLYRLIGEGKIRSTSLSDNDHANPSQRGKRLFDLASIAEYLDSLSIPT